MVKPTAIKVKTLDQVDKENKTTILYSKLTPTKEKVHPWQMDPTSQ